VLKIFYATKIISPLKTMPLMTIATASHDKRYMSKKGTTVRNINLTSVSNSLGIEPFLQKFEIDPLIFLAPGL
jgi:hypothetical protein